MSTKNTILVQERKKQAFTLVELIIVITILAILATIAFVSFQWYTSKSRDSNRVSVVKAIENGVNIFQAKSWKIPEPDNIFAIGNMSGTELNTVWYIWDTISKQINLNEIPIDPKISSKYRYWVDILKRYFQVWFTLEDSTFYTSTLPHTFAAWDIKTAGVIGNYKYPLLYSWSLWPLPSLLFTGTQVFSNTGTCFVVDGWLNTFENTWTWCVETIQQSLEIITGNSGVTLASVEASCNNLDDHDWETLYGVTYSMLKTQLSCQKTSQSWSCVTERKVNNANYTKWRPSNVNQAWQNTDALQACYFSCQTDYHWESGDCLSNTKSVPCTQSWASQNATYTIENVNITWNGINRNTAQNCSYNVCTPSFSITNTIQDYIQMQWNQLMILEHPWTWNPWISYDFQIPSNTYAPLFEWSGSTFITIRDHTTGTVDWKFILKYETNNWMFRVITQNLLRGTSDYWEWSDITSQGDKSEILDFNIMRNGVTKNIDFKMYKQSYNVLCFETTITPYTNAYNTCFNLIDANTCHN